MPRFLPLASFLLAAASVRAQQPVDSLASRPATIAPADSSRLMVCIEQIKVEIVEQRLPSFTTIQPALSRVPGVQVTPYSGAPGAWRTVRIRGIANVTGNRQPLYVVDGVPAYNTDATPELWNDVQGIYRNSIGQNLNNTPHSPTANPLLDLPVEDIATVEVVKGAAATARYGAQGSNGVILISTRRGADGSSTPQPLRVRYAGWGGVQQVRQRYALLDARQYVGVANAAAAAQGEPALYSPADLANLGEADWQSQVFRVAGMQSHNLSLDGLGRHTRYYVAADYLQQTGVVRGSDLSRYQLRANLDQQLTEKLSVGLRASASQTDQQYAGTNFDAGPLLQNALRGIPAVPDRSFRPSGNVYNPLEELLYYRSTPRTRRLLVQLNATYQFSPVLRLTVRASREQTEARELSYSPNNLPPAAPQVVETGQATTSMHNWVAEAALNYQRTLADRHALTATLGYLRQQYDRKLENETRARYSSSSFGYSEGGNAVHSPSTSVGYTYAGRYEVQASLRADVLYSTSNYPTNYRLLPGAQLSWHAHKESFLANATALSELTLWAGTGQTASFFSPGFSPPDRTTHHDAGLRLGLLGGHLTLDAGAYQRRTRHAQTVVPISFLASGGNLTSPISFPNVTLLNRGFELSVGSTWQLGPLAGTSQLAAATNRQEVENIDVNIIGAKLNGLEVGQPLARFYVYEQQGTYPVGSPQAGERRYRDRNGNGQFDFGDGYYEGTGLPRYTLSLYQQLRWRRLLLDAQFDGLFGYRLLNQTLVLLDDPSSGANSSVRALDYWTPTHQNTNVPQPDALFRPQLSNLNLENGNHLRLSQLSIAYEVLNKGPRRASVWVGGQNLFVAGSYRGFDPNVSSGGAAPLQAGLDASVYPVARV